MPEQTWTESQIMELLKQIATDLEKLRKTNKAYYDEDQYYQSGWNACLDEVQSHLKQESETKTEE